VPASRFRFHPAAELELGEAADWYEARRDGLGVEFVHAVREKIATLLDAPTRWRLVRGTRRALLGRFPYAIVYREVSADEIEIVAIAHFKRRPRYWARR
jgi:plasmid stabilization system protein ParE